MTDLVKRLRDWQHVYPEDQDKHEGHLYEVAADRIEEFEAEVAKAREEGRRAGLEEAARAIADLEDDYGEFAAIVALDRAHKNIRALAQASAQAGEE